MFALAYPVAQLLLILLQATPEASPLRVTVVGQKSFRPETLAEWGALLSAVAIIFGGFWALIGYRNARRLKAAEILLSMEEEFRIVLPTFELIENRGVYETKIRPLLILTNAGASLCDDQIKLLADLDRSLRFLFMCSVLNRDLAVESNALMRAYYHYVEIVARTTTEPANDLGEYIKNFYPKLCDWITCNDKLLRDYKEGKPFKGPFWKFWSRPSKVSSEVRERSNGKFDRVQ